MVHSRGLHGTDFFSLLPPTPAGFPTPTCYHKNWSQTQPQSRNVILGVCDKAKPYRQFQMCKYYLRNRLNYQRFPHGPYTVAQLHNISENMLDVVGAYLLRVGKIFRLRYKVDQYLGLFLGNVVNYSLIIGLFRPIIFRPISLER
jgi:hypothetical protein